MQRRHVYSVVQEGDEATFVCHVTFDPAHPSSLSWKRVNQDSQVEILYDFTYGGEEKQLSNPNKYQVSMDGWMDACMHTMHGFEWIGLDWIGLDIFNILF